MACLSFTSRHLNVRPYIYNNIYYVMPRVGRKLKNVDIADHNSEVVEEKPIENITDAQELNMIKEEIENNEKMRIKLKGK